MLFFKSKPYSEAAFIEGVYSLDPKMELELHKLCRDYFVKNFNKPGVDEEGKKDIFQSSELALWENIRNRRLYVENGELKGKDGNPFTSTLTTYFFGIVHNKYLEWLRKRSVVVPLDSSKVIVSENFIEEDNVSSSKFDNTRRLSIVASRISHMSKQCNRILTLFYYEEKDYDEIMILMPTFTSKEALKTAKYKCLKRLRDSVIGTYC